MSIHDATKHERDISNGEGFGGRSGGFVHGVSHMSGRRTWSVGEAMKLTPDEMMVLKWSESCAIVWPTGADDHLYLAGRHLEQMGLIANVQHSPELWVITPEGRAALVSSVKR